METIKEPGALGVFQSPIHIYCRGWLLQRVVFCVVLYISFLRYMIYNQVFNKK